MLITQISRQLAFESLSVHKTERFCQPEDVTNRSGHVLVQSTFAVVAFLSRISLVHRPEHCPSHRTSGGLYPQ